MPMGKVSRLQFILVSPVILRVGLSPVVPTIHALETCRGTRLFQLAYSLHQLGLFQPISPLQYGCLLIPAPQILLRLLVAQSFSKGPRRKQKDELTAVAPIPPYLPYGCNYWNALSRQGPALLTHRPSSLEAHVGRIDHAHPSNRKRASSPLVGL
jgi:hypothetical protein